jgi:hypothetical protein
VVWRRRPSPGEAERLARLAAERHRTVRSA